MSKEKQIESTDWLTRDIPKEQLEREKREAIMSADLQGCITYDEWSAREHGIESVDFDTTAEKMVAMGYRKQSVVVDEFTKRLKEVPIKCGLPLLGLSTKNEIEEYFNDIMMQVSDAIDNVAKGMKGGEGE